MRILFISNFFPPHHLSGFEMLCYDVAQSLYARGHVIQVLTSDYQSRQAQGETADFDVLRLLKLDSDIDYYDVRNVFRYWPQRKANARHVRHAIATFQPDVVFIWGMWNLSRDVALTAEQIAGPRVVYYFADAWPTRPSAHLAYWTSHDGTWRGRLFKRGLRPFIKMLLWPEWQAQSLRFEHALCCSRATYQEIVAAGIVLPNASVVYEGIDLAPFLAAAASRQDDQSVAKEQLSLVYVGRLVAHKGVHTVLHALTWLRDHAEPALDFRLTILGKGHPDYEAHLQELVRAESLDQMVEFVKPIPREQLPQFLGRFDILILPSIYEEPLARIMQDALAAGLVVIATWTGGTKETIVDGQNGLVFMPEDHVGLAQQILRAARDPVLRSQLRANAVRTAREMFDLKRMTDNVEAFLRRIAEKANP
jgi:glycosyltransferase involved in cell wall biosynthesis